MEASLTSTDYWIESYNRLNMFGVPKNIDIGHNRSDLQFSADNIVDAAMPNK